MIPVSEILDTTMGDRLPGIQGVVYGAALMAVMMYAPEGLYWRARSMLLARTRRQVGATRPVSTPAEAEAAAPAVPAAARQVLMDVRGVSKAFMGLQALS